MNLELLKEWKVFLIIGGMGTGKTVFANNLKEGLEGNLEIVDDFLYLQHSNVNHKRYFETMNKISMIRHTNDKIALCLNYSRVGRRLYQLLDDPFSNLNKLMVIVYTSAEFEILANSPIKIPSSILEEFRRSYHSSIAKPHKTRPYLVVTRRNGFRIGRYKNKALVYN